MFASFLFTLREGLEAALIVGLIAAYVTKMGRRDLLKQVLTGTAIAAALCVVVGAVVLIALGRLPTLVQESFEGIAGVLAIAVLTWMLFWMRRQGRAMKGQLEREVDVALARGTAWALVGMAFIAVVREGLELTLFLLPIFNATSDTLGVFLAGALGLGVAFVIGWAIFRLGVRVNLGRFFSVTGIVLIFVAAGLMMFAIAEFTDAGLIPVARPLFDVSGVLSQSGPVGSLLSGFFGYRDSPTALMVAAYLLYLVPVLALFAFGDRVRRVTSSFRRVSAGS